MSVSLPILSVGNCRPGHPWGVSEIAATYLNKTLYRGAIRPPIRIPTSIQINKLSCNECAALQGQPPRLTNCPTSSLPNVPVYILWYSPLVPTLHPLHSNRDKNEFATFAKEKKEKRNCTSRIEKNNTYFIADNRTWTKDRNFRVENE